MTAIWPDSLPKRFTVASYQETLPDNVIYSEVSIGPAKARRRTTANVWDQTGTMVMTYDQYRAFLRFRSEDVSDGAKAFWFPDRLGGPNLLVRFKEPPKATLDANLWQVAITLEVLP
ncbi:MULTISPECIES: hypothetical protein [unclassified Rhizobium]|uniref:hypothetical protein n=1 Tax=unclassified Rhizobium TaxID=2613769 RepID=UPI001ADBF85B|nr:MULTISPECIES: hypothetical protein [unclassified Rhizobium]MBO9124846.1 hypothetical protein [Rhizobium sp. 16-488-2b]MBO9175430.1 hypothetical protein [Rhizobium sp. 16-488-2a]